MRQRARMFVVLVSLLGLVAMALPAVAEHEDRPRTTNMHPIGHIKEPASFPGPVHTDLAFWGKHAFQGNWFGFSIRDISAPGNPKPVSFTGCTGGQGDVVVWENILVRSWDSGAMPGSGAPPGAVCGGEEVPLDFAGLHIFDVSDLTAPQLIGAVDLGPSAPPGDGRSCGSHTATGVPDLDNNRLLIYNGPSTFACPWIDVVEIPLDAPEDAAFIRQIDTERPCHDNSVILGDAMLAACAGGDGFTLLSLDPADGGSLDNPVFIASIDVNEVIVEEGLEDGGVVSIGHSSAFTWDGQVLVFGHEPGGGVQARCMEETPDTEKSAFFFDTETLEFLGMWTLPRPQGPDENCTFHNFNVVPLRSDRYVLAQGSYQSGTSLVDFTDPANAVELGWSDPPSLGPGPFCSETAPPGCQLGGAWSSYWYNGFIYETDITEGLNVFRFSGRETAGAIRLSHLNPQTQEFTLP
jgi:hypothetical protein